jgi:hypothetical protein
MTDLDPAADLVATTLIPHTAFDTAAKRIHQCCKFGMRASDPVCLAVVGESRTGKSRLLEECAAAFPSRRTEAGIVKPVINVSTPSKPTVKGLAAEMLRAIGDPRHEEGTEIAKTARLYRLMEEIGSRVLLIDEFQHFYDKATNQVMHHVADWLKILVDQTKVVLIVSGLPTCWQVIDQNEQLVGRFLAPLVMPRFNWADEYLREEFLAILAAFHEAMSAQFEMPDLASEEMGLRMYCATGGLMGYITRLLRQLVWNAIDGGERRIVIADFAKAHGDCHWDKEDEPLFEAFTPGFRALPTPELLARAALLGTKRDNVQTSSRKSLSIRPKSSLVLSAR